jgi:hypothetical protein
MFKRPEDQYKSHETVAEMVKQIQAEFKPKECGSTTVFPEKDSMGHSLIRTHKCMRDKGHEDKCRCICNLQFTPAEYRK